MPQLTRYVFLPDNAFAFEFHQSDRGHLFMDTDVHQGGMGRDLGTARVDLAAIGVGLTTEEVLVPLHADLTGFFCGELRLGLRFAGVEPMQLGCAQPFENLSKDEIDAARILGYSNAKQWDNRDKVGMRPPEERTGGPRGTKWKDLGQRQTLCILPYRTLRFSLFCRALQSLFARSDYSFGINASG